MRQEQIPTITNNNQLINGADMELLSWLTTEDLHSSLNKLIDGVADQHASSVLRLAVGAGIQAARRNG